MEFLATKNPVSVRIYATFTDEGLGRYAKDYPDDRLAFWHAHWEMIKERPLMGHGMHLGTEYRTPYYESIGLGDFIKKYEAHNQYIQVTTNGGFVGLCLFLTWLGWYLIKAWSLQKKSLTMMIVFQSLAGISFAGLSQNAFQDSEVRFAMLLMITIFLS